MAEVLGREVEDLVGMAPWDLGLLLLAQWPEGEKVHPTTVTSQVTTEARERGASQDVLRRLAHRIVVAWRWLEREGYVAPDLHESSGWQTVTREGAQADRATVVQTANLGLLRVAELDTGLRSAVIELFRLGRFGDAVMVAMREVEIRVRAAADLAADDVGKDLVRKALGADGPLRDPELPGAEQEGVMQLFMGAIAVLKNPHSHRLVNIDDPQEAVESVLFANNLLRLVGRAGEARRKRESHVPPIKMAAMLAKPRSSD